MCDQLVVHDLHDHLAGRHRLDDLDADRALLDLLDEGARHVERHVGFEQRAAHLAQRRVDVGSSDSAPRRVRRSRMPESFSDRLSNIASQSATIDRYKTLLRPRAHRAVGRVPPASQDRSAELLIPALVESGRNIGASTLARQHLAPVRRVARRFKPQTSRLRGCSPALDFSRPPGPWDWRRI